MHRWFFQRLFRLLIPSLVFVIALCVVIIERKNAGIGLTFLDDGAYENLSVARTVQESRTYGLTPADDVPAVKDVLWRLSLGLTSAFVGDVAGSAHILGAIFSIVTLLLCIRIARFLFPFPPFIMYASILLVLAPPLLMQAISGTAAAMSTALVTAACLLHIESVASRRSPLSTASALVIATLMWIRIEFALLWIVFMAHSLILSNVWRSRKVPAGLVMVKGLSGILILALGIVPLLLWNIRVLGVPWPQAVGAPITLDMAARLSPAEMTGAYFSFVRGAVGSAYGFLFGAPFISGVFELLLVVVGALAITGLAIWREEERPYTLLLFVLVALPPVYALAWPALGWRAAPLVFQSLTPLWILAASFAIFRAPFLIESIYRRYKEGLPEPVGFNTWWIVMGSILLVVSIARNGSAMHRNLKSLAALERERQAVSETIRSGELEDSLFLTDSPGWLAYTHRLPLLDLNGDNSPAILACLNEKGGLDRVKVERLLANLKPGAMVLWNAANSSMHGDLPTRALPVVLDGKEPQEMPVVHAINWSGVF